MKILLTNDDGIHSPLFKILAQALKSVGSLTIAAPATEQSWIGKAMSRHKNVSINTVDTFNTTAYSISGTPGDCVNIALNHLVEEKPDWIVSGINIGHNAGLACIASSGTVAAAVEGCLHQIPSLAASIYLPPEIFDILKDGHDVELPSETIAIIEQASVHIAQFIAKNRPSESDSYGIVHNLNFPYKNLADTEIKETKIASTMTHSLFEKNEAGEFEFTYHEMTEVESKGYKDRECLKDGHISYSKINYGNLSR